MMSVSKAITRHSLTTYTLVAMSLKLLGPLPPFPMQWMRRSEFDHIIIETTGGCRSLEAESSFVSEVELSFAFRFADRSHLDAKLGCSIAPSTWMCTSLYFLSQISDWLAVTLGTRHLPVRTQGQWCLLGCGQDAHMSSQFQTTYMTI